MSRGQRQLSANSNSCGRVIRSKNARRGKSSPASLRENLPVSFCAAMCGSNRGKYENHIDNHIDIVGRPERSGYHTGFCGYQDVSLDRLGQGTLGLL
ncbi:hypothetical protein [Bradyrhizobium sp. 186]|uniref:hypothetical protein n=1 Tax=Bradyrhizobium sp. 186 TaxID=2782654 RepID=UPI003211BF08